MSRTLVVVRHAKSDWSVPVHDLERPIGARGRRQAPAIGEWLAENGLVPDLILISPATRARQTWECVVEALAARGEEPAEGSVVVDEAVYTFDGNDLLAALRRASSDSRVLAIVGHNPAMEQLVEALTGQSARMRTSSIAVISVSGDWADLGRADAGAGQETGARPRLMVIGRPADEALRAQ